MSNEGPEDLDGTIALEETPDPQTSRGGSTTDIGAGPDPFEPSEVPIQVQALPLGVDGLSFSRVGNPRFDAFAFTVGLGQQGYLLPEDPNRAFFKVTAVVPATTCTVYIGKAGQLINGYGWPVGLASVGSDQKFTSTEAVHVTMKDTANGGAGTPGETGTVYVWVEYAV